MKNANEERTVVMTPAETAFIERFTADYCRPHAVVMAERLARFVEERRLSLLSGGHEDVAMAAGVSAPEPPKVRAPDEAVDFAFVSDGESDAPGAWKAKLVVPPRAEPETMLELTVEDGRGVRMNEGTFTLAGVALPLAGGVAKIPFGMFIAGIKDVAVSYRRPDGAAVAGTLAFFG